MKADHVVMDSKTQAFTCLHCGQSYKPAMPCPINMFTAMANSFSEMHRHCQPKTNQPAN